MPWSKDDYRALGRIHLISSTTVEGAIYGFVFALYIFCARSLYIQLKDRDRRRQHLFTLFYMSIAMALELSAIAVNAFDIQTSYVDHADYPGGGYAYFLAVFLHSPVAVWGYFTSLLLSLMMSGVQIWRLWVIRGASPYFRFIVVLPVLSLLVYTGFYITTTVILAQSLVIDRRLRKMVLYGQIVPQLCISTIVTSAIIAQIYMVQRRNTKILGQADNSGPYTCVISMLIESFALESVWLIIQLIFLPTSQNLALANTFGFFSNTQSVIQLLAYFLVIYQVTTGRAWKEDAAEKLTTLQWNRDELQTTWTGARASIPTHNEV